ncbi:MAG: hypothetical protein JRJ19_03270 [Deltaproteobacteria bacterium]|nr:hypothetical protein [Deltaproteobacteria bacterium]
MKNLSALFLVLGLLAVPSSTLAVAFEEHTSWHKEPNLETEKGISLGQSVIEMGMRYRFLFSDSYFNSDAKIDDAPYKYSVSIMEFFGAFGFTENWTMWLNIPVVCSTESDVERARTSNGDIGDCETGALYQFFRRSDPTLSMGLGLRWKLPTGSEAPGAQTFNITGTGITDVELFYLGRWQIIQNLSVGWATGYNIRFPGSVQYLFDRHTSITNAFLDLGDELFFRIEAIGAIDMLSVSVTAEFRYRFPTKVGMAEYIAEDVHWTNPRNDNSSENDDFLLFNGATYKEWDVHERLDPTRPMVSNAGYLFSVSPRIIFRPLTWLDFTVYAKFHLLGKNTIYLTDKDENNTSFNNFMPMQMLGYNLGDVMVLGEAGAHFTTRW